MTQITAEHLARGAFIYVRQSTSDQVLHNHESRRRQYGLADRARALGWSAVEVIDDDLGRSGSGIARPGFEKLLAAICEGRVGAVVSIEASRRPQRARLAYAARVLRVGRHTDRRRGRGVRSAASERSPAAWHEGHDERDGAVAFPPALARSPEAEGAAR